MIVKDKPDIQIEYSESVKTYDNILMHDVAQSLIDYATSEDSGLHRRGSKNPERCTASFATCMVYRLNNPIYEILNPIWDRYISDTQSNLDFIEPYEIKIYNVRDKFNYHHDSFGNVNHKIDRKINLIIQLSEEHVYAGGDLFVGDYWCTRKFGSAIFFPAHYFHRVTEVTHGTRISLIGHAWGPVIR